MPTNYVNVNDPFPSLTGELVDLLGKSLGNFKIEHK